MIVGQCSKKHKIQIVGKTLQQVDRFTYLVVTIDKEGTLKDEINDRIAITV